jgi:hypothetical protein
MDSKQFQAAIEKRVEALVNQRLQEVLAGLGISGKGKGKVKGTRGKNAGVAAMHTWIADYRQKNNNATLAEARKAWTTHKEGMTKTTKKTTRKKAAKK